MYPIVVNNLDAFLYRLDLAVQYFVYLACSDGGGKTGEVLLTGGSEGEACSDFAGGAKGCGGRERDGSICLDSSES